MDVFRLLDQSPVVLSFDILDHRTWKTGSYIRLKAVMRDGSELAVREYVSETDRKYSFHWQSGDGTLRVRWDNAPHHPALSTHPDHKHVAGIAEASTQISLDDVLAEIQAQLL